LRWIGDTGRQEGKGDGSHGNPEPGPMEVLLRVDSAACCSTDVALMNNPMPGQPPYGDFIPGHEYAPPMGISSLAMNTPEP
jgi:D-arabinose 1-dehydrogenase-like Zn-dependent alcohol dehydrogenase